MLNLEIFSKELFLFAIKIDKMEKKYHTVDTITKFEELKQNEDAVLIYFSHEKCNVCKILKPKVAQMLNETYPKIKMVYADTVNSPEIAGQNSVFAVPTIVVFMGGREYIRKSRNIGIRELVEEIERPYNMMFEN